MDRNGRNFIVHVSLHGLLRPNDPELGRDADTGGQILYVLDLAKALCSDQRIARVDVVTRLIPDASVGRSYSIPSERLCDKGTVVRLPFGPERYLCKEELWYHVDEAAAALENFLLAQPMLPGWLHAHYADAGAVCCHVGKRLGIPVVFTAHSLGRVKLALGYQGESFASRLAAEEACLAMGSAVIASSEDEVKRQYSLYKTRAKKMRTIAPGVAVEEFAPRAEAAMPGALGHLADPFATPILAVSRLDRKKNLAALVRAAADVEGCNLVMVLGKRPAVGAEAHGLMQELEGLVKELKVEGKTALVFGMPRGEVQTLFRWVKQMEGVFVQPCIDEPFGLTLLEAAAAGLPVVASERGGPSSIVPLLGNGLLVDVEKAEGIRAGIRSVLQEGEKWQERAKGALPALQRHFSWQAHVQKYLAAMQAQEEPPERRKAEQPPEAQCLLPEEAKSCPLWLLKALQFSSSSVVTVILKFSIVFWRDLDISGPRIAWLNATSLLVLFSGSLFWSSLIDRTDRVRQILAASQLACCCWAAMLLTAQVQASYPLLLLVTAATVFFMSSIYSVIDAICLAILRASTEGEGYGQQRAYNAAGCGATSIVVGFIMDHWGTGAMYWAFFAEVALLLCLVLLAMPDIELNGAKKRSEKMLPDLSNFVSKEVAFLFLNLVMYGIPMSLIEVYLPLFYVHELGAPRALVGLSVGIMCATEVPVFHAMDKVLGGRLSPGTVLGLCQGVLVLRCMLYALLPQEHPSLFLLVEPLHGLNFAAMWSAVVRLAEEMAPDGFLASMQAAISGVYFLLTFSLGGIIWAHVLEDVGFQGSFLASVVFTTLWSTVWLACRTFLKL